VQKQTKRKMKMKKLIIAAFAVAFAAATQAATVVWGGAVATVEDDMGVIGEGATAYLLWSSTAYLADATKLSAAAIGGTTNNGGTIVATYNITSGDAGNGVFEGNYYKSGSVDGYYAVLVKDPTASDKLSYYYVGNLLNTTEQSSLADTNIQLNPLWSSGEYLNQGGYTVAVPEPTSGLLLLLGMAGLALKRKRA
jgi:hypothetical protein